VDVEHPKTCQTIATFLQQLQRAHVVLQSQGCDGLAGFGRATGFAT